ncbi:MAG: glycosyltransferase N-terminal domain-containing protein [Flavobacteriaceae bacterium]|nr:glycosyltransferase N-terminal domain-containing protein [Flavobacteriaceae bacterium]
MQFVYSLLTQFVQSILPVGLLVGGKVEMFVKGRKNTFLQLKKALHSSDKTFWFHVASLGEYEQGIPVIEAIKKKHPNHKIVLTFFSPSGYEVQKNNTLADVTTYLPLDTPKNVQRFLSIVRPEKVFFVKYEFWPNYLKELKERNVPTYLIAGIFRKQQWFFKPSGGWIRKTLSCFTLFFVQNNTSKQLLQSIGFNNVVVSGDSRFDRVLQITQRDNSLDFMEQFTAQKLCVVAGSTWPEDEALWIKYFEQKPAKNICWVLVPHEIQPKKIKELASKIPLKTVCYSEIESNKPIDADVLIVDTIGLLTKIYSYANIAYVGGGMGSSGLHNTLEPAVFGIPVLIGKHFQKFEEASKLVALGGIQSISDYSSFQNILTNLIDNKITRNSQGAINLNFVKKESGSVDKILSVL